MILVSNLSVKKSSKEGVRNGSANDSEQSASRRGIEDAGVKKINTKEH